MPRHLRAALVVGLATDPDGRVFVGGGAAPAPSPGAALEPTQEKPMPKPMPPVFPVRRDEKKLVLTQRTMSVDVAPEKLLELLRAAGVDVPDDAQVQLAWSDRDERPHLAKADTLVVTWTRVDESEA